MNKLIYAYIAVMALACSAVQASFNDSLKQQLAVFKADSERYLESLTRQASLIELSERTKFQAAILIEEINQIESQTSSELLSNTTADEAFAELDEQRRSKVLPEKKNQLRQLAAGLKRSTNELNLLAENISLLKARLIDDKNLLVKAVLENFQQREFKRSISFECGNDNKEKCQETAREFVLRELSEELSGATVESQTLIKNFLVVEDSVKVNSSHDFEEIKVVSVQFNEVNNAFILDLELVATVSQLATSDELLKLEQALDQRINDFINQLSHS